MAGILLKQNTHHLLSVYDQAFNFTISNHIHSPNILSKDRVKKVLCENHNVIIAKQII